MSKPRHWRHGERAARRAGRQHRTWTIVAIVGTVVLVAAGGVAAAAVLLDRDETSVASPAPRRSDTAHPTSSSTTTPSVAGLPCRDELTPDAPLRLWIAGDSIAYSVGNGLGKRAANTGVVAPVYESRVSSGLMSPGFFDWPRRVTEELSRLNPEVVVFVMGTNDWMAPQATPVDTTGQPAWKTTYERQVQAMVDALTASGRVLYWVGPPVLRDPKQETGAREVAAVIARVVKAHANAVFVDAHNLFDTDDGSYTSTLDIAGKRVQVRSGDGIHLSDDGADYLGDELFARLDAQCDLKAQAVSGAHQPLIETRGSTSVGGGSSSGSGGAAATVPRTTPPSVAATTPPATPTSPPAATTPTVAPTSPPAPATTAPPPATTATTVKPG